MALAFSTCHNLPNRSFSLPSLFPNLLGKQTSPLREGTGREEAGLSSAHTAYLRHDLAAPAARSLSLLSLKAER